MRPQIETQITQHTVWQALTGQLPPLHLWPTPIPHAVLDNRDVTQGDLFVAFKGANADGHDFVAKVIEWGAGVVICEERGRAAAIASGATVIDCVAAKTGAVIELPAQLLNTATQRTPLAYIVPNTTLALQAVGGFQRMHRSHPALRVIGITGSVGKTSTKELAAAVLRQRFHTLHNPGNLNSEQGLPFTLLGLESAHERAVLEMGMYDVGEIHRLCELARPQVGIVTNVGPVHLERLGTVERIAQAKSELVQALPSANDGGLAILNWDDELVRGMAEQTKARVFKYGLTDEADLWADEITGAGLEGIRFRFHHRKMGSGKIESLHVRVPLLGRHSVHTALRAAALGLNEGLGWDEIVVGLQSLPSQLRLVVGEGINRSTVIDDTYNASPASTIAALNLLADLQPNAQGRRIAVLGDMRELGSFSDEGHKLVGRRAAEVVDLLVTVGELGQVIGAAASEAGLTNDQRRSFGGFAETITYLHNELRQHDLALVKGSRAVGMETIAAQITVSNGHK